MWVDCLLSLPKYNDNLLPDSLYLSTKELSSTIGSIANSNTVSLLHVNCRSLSKNYTNLTILLKQLQCPIPFIALSETWTTLLSENDFHLPVYNFVAKSRINTSGGGVGIYIADNIAFKQRDDLRPSSDNVFECIFIESLADNLNWMCLQATW